METGVVYTMSMKDRFSDYGVVGVAIATPGGTTASDDGGAGSDEWEIDSFLMSCRAFGRKIESELLRTVLDDARRSGVRLVRANRIPTANNGMTRNFYPDHGFSEIGGDGKERYAIDPAESIRRRADGQGQGLYRVTLCGFDATTPQRIPEPRSSRTP